MESIYQGHAKRWSTLPILLAGAFLPVLDTFIISIILPTVRQDLGANSVQSQLVASAFSGFFALFLITGARLGDLLGRRKIFLLGILGFALASLFCGFSINISMLIFGRALQGISGALLAPQVLASINSLFPASEKGKAIGLLGTTYSLSGIIGLTLSGCLIAMHPFNFTWQSIFIFYSLMAFVVAVIGYFVIPETKNSHAQGLDWGGVLFLFLALFLLIFPLTEGRVAGWPLWSFILLGLSFFAWIGFSKFEIQYSKKGKVPLVDFELFKDQAFSLGLLISLLYYISFAFLFCFSFYLQAVKHLSALQIGLLNLPFALGFFFSSLFAPALLNRLKTKVLALGFGMLSIGLLCLLTVVILRLDYLIGLSLGLAGLGNGLTMSSNMKVVTAEMEPRHVGLASGALMSVMQIGNSLGIVLLGGVFFMILGNPADPKKYDLAFGSAMAMGALVLAVNIFLSLRIGRYPKKLKLV